MTNGANYSADGERKRDCKVCSSRGASFFGRVQVNGYVLVRMRFGLQDMASCEDRFADQPGPPQARSDGLGPSDTTSLSSSTG